MQPSLTLRGFLPTEDPLPQFPPGSPYELLDQLGHDLPSLLIERDFRRYLCQLHLPSWQSDASSLPELRLYYLRMGFIASAYINQVGFPPSPTLPANIAIPLCQACNQLARPPILSYDGYALYNWKRFNDELPVALGNIDTLQNFVHLYDEHWFILIHIEIEALAAGIFAAINSIQVCANNETVNLALRKIAQILEQQIKVLERIPEHMSPTLYFREFRPYIRFFENVTYEGVNQSPIAHRGETGAQSSIMPSLIAFLKIPHQSNQLINHLQDMRNYMPNEHQQVIKALESMPSIIPFAEPEAFNQVLENIACFREVHLGWAQRYINDKVSNPLGTGGTPYMHWLQQLIDETRQYKRH